MRRRTLIAGLMIAGWASQVEASDANALAIEANIQATHVPFGTVLDPIFASPASSQIVGYTRCGDSAIWTGHYLAAEAFRYQVTQSPSALDNVKQALAGIKSLLDVTGTNVLARCLVPLNSPYAAGIQSEEAANGIYSNTSMGYFWVGNTSRDQYMGVIFGLGVAYDMVNDVGAQTSISQIATRLIQFLESHAWTIVMPDGSISTTFIPRPDEILTLLQVGAHVNPTTFSTDYDINKVLLAAGVLAPVAVDAASDSSYFKFNLDYISFYNLIRLESGSSKSIYQAAYQVLRAATASDQNAMFDLIDRGLNGPNASRDAEAAGLLNEWLQRPSRDNPVNLNGVVPVCSGQACQPIPVALRPPDEYLWEESPYQLAGGGSGIIETAGVDYILPYWMARYYGVVPPVALQSAAAPNAAVTPESIASIFGSNLSAITQPANIQPPPQSLGGVTLTVTDSTGAARVAPLMYVSPTQINFVVPSGSATGLATFATANASTFGIIQPVAPTLFSMSGDGRGVAAADAIAVQGSSQQTSVPVFQCSTSGCVSTPIQLSANQTVYLILYGTGIRNRSSLANVTANIGGTNVPVLYAGPQPSFEGLDQVNVTLPASLSGSGEINVVLTVDGQTANPVTVNIR
ncbi:MAG TPA: hypothetical protein VK752_22510 [Bryobacteraceae bacterium]|nr:hypothetical protein [Bryobacteraceae bacterium]